MLRLKQLLELPADYDLRLADDLGDAQLPPAPVFAARVVPVEAALGPTQTAVSSLLAAPLPERNAVAEAATVVSLREAALKAVEAERMPSVSFNSTYGRIAYPSGAFPDVRPRELVARRRDERADPHRRAAEGRRDGGARRHRAGAAAAEAGAGTGGARHARGVGGARGRARRVGIERRDGAAGDPRLRDRRRALSERRVHAARAVGLAAAAAAGRSQPRARRARPAGGPRAGGAAARTPARRRHTGRGAARRRAGPAAGTDAATAAAGKRSVHKRGRARGSRRRGPDSHDASQGSHRIQGTRFVAGTTGLARASARRRAGGLRMHDRSREGGHACGAPRPCRSGRRTS